MNAALLGRVLGAFADASGGAPDLVAQAPGRVNLIGEHTDYNDGFVLPCAIDRGTLVAARSREDENVTVVAADYLGERDGFSLAGPIESLPDGGWTNYVRGMVKLMAAESNSATGVDLAIAGDVPRGAGLSSSASLAVAIGEALKAIWGLGDLGPHRLARMAQRVEGEFAGCRCGIMDPLISAAAVAGHALLIDCRSLDTRPVPILEDLAILIVHSGVSRDLARGAYNERRASCEAAARHFGVAALRDLDLAALEAGCAGLDPVVFRRARHVVTENSRTLAAAEALARGDLPAIGRLMAASHASMREDFEITVPAVDRLVEILVSEIGPSGGARMTGGGFGGAVVALLPSAVLDRVRSRVQAIYRAPDGAPPLVIATHASAGAGLVANFPKFAFTATKHSRRS